MNEKVTLSDKIWKEIENKQINLFSLPNQTIGQHVRRVPGVPSELYLEPLTPAIVVAIEEVLPSRFQLTQAKNGWIIISEKDISG